ncbi:MAG TPA: hypothetical protein VD838_06670 [Anaeromyxobacteraceae bacterium]|nr:hypothetical protein [Anaeromyxobacteraceae bacterium]
MNNLFRGLIAGYGAHKLGGGCLSTILVFIVIWVLLGQCGAAMPPLPEPEAAKTTITYPALSKEAHALTAVPLTLSPIAAGIAVS